jgi:chemotaxis protein CheZ
MMMHVEKEDLDELMSLLEKVSQTAAFLTDESNRQEKLETVRQGLLSFHTTAAMLGLETIEQSGVALQDFFTSRIAAATAVDAGLILPFVSTINAILGEMKRCLNGNGELTFNVERVIEILYAIPESLSLDEVGGELTEDELPGGLSPDSRLDEADSGDAGGKLAAVISETDGNQQFDVGDLKRVTEGLGGELLIASENGDARSIQLSFPISRANIHKIQTLLSAFDLNSAFAAQLSQQDSRTEKVLQLFQQFVGAFSGGDMKQAQEILLDLAEQQQQAGLYKQVGVLARKLHDSLKGFVDTLDPALIDIVEDKIPDSGSRLEHILKLTENAANTTLDHVEVMQRRNQEQQTKLANLRETLGGMRAIGDKAQHLLGGTHLSLDDLQDSLSQTSTDLITVLTAQDYQDLTGQIILKIIDLLKDLELKLVNVIRTFGVPLESQKQVVTEELYGPAHTGRAAAMHSQDDVDSLLAEFGF